MGGGVRVSFTCRELWDGPRAGTEDAVEFTGVDEVSVHIHYTLVLAIVCLTTCY